MKKVFVYPGEGDGKEGYKRTTRIPEWNVLQNAQLYV